MQTESETKPEPTHRNCYLGRHLFLATEPYSYERTYDKDGVCTEENFICRQCDQAQTVGRFLTDGVLTTKISVDAAIREVRERLPEPWARRVMADMALVQGVARRWEEEVWFNGHDRGMDPAYTQPYAMLPEYRQYLRDAKGRLRKDLLPPGSLQEFVLKAKMKGYSAEVNGLRYDSYTMCGRSIWQITDTVTERYVQIILDEDSPTPRGGVNNIKATAEDACRLIRQSIADWKAGLVDIKESNVGLGV